MKISVIIPVYNSEKTIIRALNSVFNQTAINNIHEIIIVNDGSGDRSVSLINDFKQKNSLIPIILINQENSGVSSARNIGIKKSSGDWIALLDSDDEWLNDKIEYQTNVLNNNPHIDFLGGAHSDKALTIIFKKINLLHKAKVYEMCIKNFPQPSTVLFKKSIFLKIGGFNQNQRYAEDGNYFIKICHSFNLYFDPKVMIFYDGGKQEFGKRGLSANLKMMYLGNISNLNEFLNLKLISKKFYIFLRIFYFFKHLRRLFIISIQNIFLEKI